MPPTCRILLVRHGESEWNAAGRWQGRADPPLSPAGREAAHRLAATLAELVPTLGPTIWTSPLQRARETATIIADHHGLCVHVDERLAERDVGEWTGLTHREIETRWPGARDAGAWPADAEPTREVVDRALDALCDVAATAAGQALVVTHAGIIRSLLARQPGHDHRVANLGGAWFEVAPAPDGARPDVRAAGRFPAAEGHVADAGSQRL